MKEVKKLTNLEKCTISYFIDYIRYLFYQYAPLEKALEAPYDYGTFEEYFKHSGFSHCYDFARILQAKYPNGRIYRNQDHFVLKIGDTFFDVDGALPLDKCAEFIEVDENDYVIEHFNRWENDPFEEELARFIIKNITSREEQKKAI